MLCTKFPRRSQHTPPTPTQAPPHFPLSPLTPQMPTSDPNENAKRQRQQFWHTVLNPPSDTDSEYSGLLPRNTPAATIETGPAYPPGVRKETPCPICRGLFKRKYDLLQHISAVHEKNRPFKCDTCDASFAHKGTLSKHVRTVHRRERPYQCEHCGLRFSERGNVNKHKQRASKCRKAEEKAYGAAHAV